MTTPLCSNCRKEAAIYKVGSAVLCYRCVRRAKDQKVPHAFDDTLLPKVRKERAKQRKSK